MLGKICWGPGRFDARPKTGFEHTTTEALSGGTIQREVLRLLYWLRLGGGCLDFVVVSSHFAHTFFERPYALT